MVRLLILIQVQYSSHVLLGHSLVFSALHLFIHSRTPSDNPEGEREPAYQSYRDSTVSRCSTISSSESFKSDDATRTYRLSPLSGEDGRR